MSAKLVTIPMADYDKLNQLVLAADALAKIARELWTDSAPRPVLEMMKDFDKALAVYERVRAGK